MTDRITDPSQVSVSEVQSILASGLTPVIQFSTDAAPCAACAILRCCWAAALTSTTYGMTPWKP